METVYLALRVLLSLGVVLGTVWYVHRRLTKGGRLPRATKAVTVVTRQQIAPKASVVVMDVDGQRFLLGVTEQSVTVLNTSDAPPPEVVVAKAPRTLAAVDSAPRSIPRATGGAAFARVLSDLQGPVNLPGPAHPAPVAYLPSENLTGTLNGSILSPTTWKRTAAALRRAR